MGVRRPGTSGERRTRRVALLTLGVVAAAALLTVGRAAPSEAAGSSPVVTYLRQLQGKHTITGQHNKEPLTSPTAWTDQVRDITGRTPGLYGGDFGFGGPYDWQTMIDAAAAQRRAGALVTLMWHVCPPTVGDACDWAKDISGDLTDAQWRSLVTDGSALNLAWKARLETTVPYLRQLRDQGVEVLLRPLHELNDDWAWWGGRPGAGGSSALYRITHDYLVSRGLTNLVWVWSVTDVDPASFAAYYPGDQYVDVVGLDSWSARFPTADTYARVAALAGSKPMALTEVSTVPTEAQLAAQPRWAYFMLWSEYLTDPGYNTPAQIRKRYATSRMLTRDEVTLATPQQHLARGRPAWASSTDDPGRTAAQAVDGDPTTRWSSSYSDDQWLYVDLQARSPLARVVLSWEQAYARKYQIQTSDDGQIWTTRYTEDAGDGGTDTISLQGVSARYVKLYSWQRGTVWGDSLWEFDVIGT